MTFIVETGGGTPNANAYDTVVFVTDYLTSRGREAENGWSGLTAAQHEQAVVAATDYVDTRFGQRFKGVRLRSFIEGRVSSATVLFAAPPTNLETVTVGQTTYRYVTALLVENDIVIGTTAQAAEYLVAAITAGGDDLTVHKATRANTEVTANVNEDAAEQADIATPIPGVNGDTIVLTSTTGATLSAATLTGGIDEGPQPLEFPRGNLYDRNGNAVVGVPLNMRQAIAEYAVRSVSSILQPDPTVDATGQAVQRKLSKVGTLESEVEYTEDAIPTSITPYPAADRMLSGYLTSLGVLR